MLNCTIPLRWLTIRAAAPLLLPRRRFGIEQQRLFERRGVKFCDEGQTGAVPTYDERVTREACYVLEAPIQRLGKNENLAEEPMCLEDLHFHIWRDETRYAPAILGCSWIGTWLSAALL